MFGMQFIKTFGLFVVTALAEIARAPSDATRGHGHLRT